MSARGKYIVIEGNDGSGKSTQVEELANWLQQNDISTFVVHEPGGVAVADAIREIIKNGTLKRDALTNLLLFSAARHEIWREAKKKLANGTWVVSARNYYSTIAYQGYGEGLDTSTILDATRLATDESYMNPDLAFILSLDSEGLKSRIDKRGKLPTPDTFEQRSSEFQNNVNQAYTAIADQYNIQIIDAAQSIESVQAQIRQALTELMKIVS